MLSVEDALERVLRLAHELPVERVPIIDADGLTLAEDVRSPFDIPALTNSAMDGYAVRAADVAGASAESPVTLEIVGQVQAGQLPSATVREGETVRIMTGAPTPQGADAIVPYEVHRRGGAALHRPRTAVHRHPPRRARRRPHAPGGRGRREGRADTGEGARPRPARHRTARLVRVRRRPRRAKAARRGARDRRRGAGAR